MANGRPIGGFASLTVWLFLIAVLAIPVASLVFALRADYSGIGLIWTTFCAVGAHRIADWYVRPDLLRLRRYQKTIRLVETPYKPEPRDRKRVAVLLLALIGALAPIVGIAVVVSSPAYLFWLGWGGFTMLLGWYLGIFHAKAEIRVSK